MDSRYPPGSKKSFAEVIADAAAQHHVVMSLTLLRACRRMGRQRLNWEPEALRIFADYRGGKEPRHIIHNILSHFLIKFAGVGKQRPEASFRLRVGLAQTDKRTANLIRTDIKAEENKRHTRGIGAEFRDAISNILRGHWRSFFNLTSILRVQAVSARSLRHNLKQTDGATRRIYTGAVLRFDHRYI